MNEERRERERLKYDVHCYCVVVVCYSIINSLVVRDTCY